MYGKRSQFLAKHSQQHTNNPTKKKQDIQTMRYRLTIVPLLSSSLLLLLCCLTNAQIQLQLHRTDTGKEEREHVLADELEFLKNRQDGLDGKGQGKPPPKPVKGESILPLVSGGSDGDDELGKRCCVCCYSRRALFVLQSCLTLCFLFLGMDCWVDKNRKDGQKRDRRRGR